MFESEIKALRKLSTRNVRQFPFVPLKSKLKRCGAVAIAVAELCSGGIDGVDDVERIGFSSEY